MIIIFFCKLAVRKISAIDGYTFSTHTGSNSSFELYLPFGEYTLSLDETILNNKITLPKTIINLT